MSDVGALFDGLRKTIATVGKDVAALESRLDELCAQRRALDHAPLPKADVVRRVDQWLADEAGSYAAQAQACVQEFFSKPTPDVSAHAHWPPPVLGLQSAQLGSHRDRCVPAALLWACREPIRAALHAEIGKLDFSQAGPPLAERDAMRRKLDQEISALEGRIGDLRDAARAAGLQL